VKEEAEKSGPVVHIHIEQDSPVRRITHLCVLFPAIVMEGPQLTLSSLCL
jgi:hypothetical protein